MINLKPLFLFISLLALATLLFSYEADKPATVNSENINSFSKDFGALITLSLKSFRNLLFFYFELAQEN
jgi:hypothetical protein